MGSLHDLVGLAGHSKRSSTRSRRQTTKACTLYTSPLATDTLPVYTNFNLTWDPTCVTMTSDNVDLYLSVEEDAGLVAVHEWTDVVYADGFLETQLKPSWWNASTGAGTVAAQVSCTVLAARRRVLHSSSGTSSLVVYASLADLTEHLRCITVCLHAVRISYLGHTCTIRTSLLHHLQRNVSRNGRVRLLTPSDAIAPLPLGTLPRPTQPQPPLTLVPLSSLVTLASRILEASLVAGWAPPSRSRCSRSPSASTRISPGTSCARGQRRNDGVL